MRFYNHITEDTKINKSVSDSIYDDVFSKALSCKDPDGSYQCHCSVYWVKSNLKDNWWYKDLKFITWNETKWKKTADKLIKDKAISKFTVKTIKELIIDISDLSVNGHSLIKFKDYYIDPYLKSRKVSDKAIQAFGKYWEKIK